MFTSSSFCCCNVDISWMNFSYIFASLFSFFVSINRFDFKVSCFILEISESNLTLCQAICSLSDCWQLSSSKIFWFKIEIEASFWLSCSCSWAEMNIWSLSLISHWFSFSLNYYICSSCWRIIALALTLAEVWVCWSWTWGISHCYSHELYFILLVWVELSTSFYCWLLSSYFSCWIEECYSDDCF